MEQRPVRRLRRSLYHRRIACERRFAARVLYTNLQMSDFGPGAVLVYALFYKFIWSLAGGGFGEIGFELLIRLLPVLVIIHFVRIRSERRETARPLRPTVASR